MSQGNIISWSKAVGDEISPGDVLCEVETDKATIAWESQEEGFLAAILVPGGSKDVPIGSPAAVLVDDKVRDGVGFSGLRSLGLGLSGFNFRVQWLGTFGGAKRCSLQAVTASCSIPRMALLADLTAAGEQTILLGCFAFMGDVGRFG